MQRGRYSLLICHLVCRIKNWKTQTEATEGEKAPRSSHSVIPACESHPLIFLQLVQDLLKSLPTLFQKTMETQSALGSALQAGFKLLSPTGGRMSVFQTQLPNLGAGALQSREDPNQRASAKVGAWMYYTQGAVHPLPTFIDPVTLSFSIVIYPCFFLSGHTALITCNRLLQEAGSGLLWPAGGSWPVPAECTVLWLGFAG